MSSQPLQNGALNGVRVLEIAHLAAAVAGSVLADLGAEVIKIEPPGGEAARGLAPLAELPGGGQVSCAWLAFNTGKKSVCVDLDSPEGLEQFARLAASADIIVSDFERLPISACDILAPLAEKANPQVIWTEILPFGRGGPYEDFPATDSVLQALGGHLFLNGDIDRPPVRIGLPVGVLQGGAEAAAAALMAYYHALRTGEGQRVDISIQECVVWTLLNTTMAWQILELIEMRGGAIRRERANRFYTRCVWPCRDGHIFFGPVGGGGGAAREKSYQALLAWMTAEGAGDPILTAFDWNGDGQFEISQANYDAVTEVISRFISSKTKEELMTRAVASRILLAPISSVGEILGNAQFRARGLFERCDDPQSGLSLEYPARWVRLSRTPLSPLSPPPLAGGDTRTQLAVEALHEKVD